MPLHRECTARCRADAERIDEAVRRTRLDIKAIAGDTGTVFIAPVPVCIVPKNWKEF